VKEGKVDLTSSSASLQQEKEAPKENQKPKNMAKK